MTHSSPGSVPPRPSAEVVVVGHGLVGAVLARTLLAAGLGVLLVDGGSPASGQTPGGHLRNLVMCRADRGYYGDLVRSHLRPVSQSRPRSALPGLDAAPMPDGNGLNPRQRARFNLPAARTTALFGGMGTVWNCVAPRLDPRWEPWPGIPEAEWPGLYERAERLLAVGIERAESAGPEAAGPESAEPESAERAASRQRFLLDTLPGARPAPLAGLGGEHRTGPPRWTGPGEILADLEPAERARLEVLGDCVVRKLRHRGGRVMAADAVDRVTGAPLTIEADHFVVAAGPLRTPALLWASGLAGAGDSPLGRYLNDHPLSYAQVVLAGPDLPTASADSGLDPDPAVLIPLAEGRPFHALLLCDRYDAALLEGRVDERLILSMYWYALSEPLFENRVRFDLLPTDAMDLPQPTFEYRLTDLERKRQAAALDGLREAGSLLGGFLPSSPPQNLSPGSSMHLMGTTRMGLGDDGHSVVNGHGRVWGTQNLYLGGTGLIPGPTATNPSLAACAAAVRTADHIIGG